MMSATPIRKKDFCTRERVPSDIRPVKTQIRLFIRTVCSEYSLGALSIKVLKMGQNSLVNADFTKLMVDYEILNHQLIFGS